jgi:hypothetical protein
MTENVAEVTSVGAGVDLAGADLAATLNLKKPSAPGDDFSKSIEWQPWQTKINAAWRKSTEGIIEAGKLLIQAKAALMNRSFESMVREKLPFSKRTAERLMKIARHGVLSNATHVSHLPPSWGTLYQLAQLSDSLCLEGLRKGTINPKMERKEAAALMPRRRIRATAGPAPLPRNGKKPTGEVAAPAPTARVREIMAPDEELAILRELAHFILTHNIRMDVGDQREFRPILARVKAILPKDA